MKDNARLVLEENQNLLEQISVKDQKTHDLHQAHLREGTVIMLIRLPFGPTKNGLYWESV